MCHPDVDMVVVATTGAVGLGPTLAALRAGKSVALANKEVIVMAGELIAQKGPGWGKILPMDSEPSAIWQCLQGEDHSVARLIITASRRPVSYLAALPTAFGGRPRRPYGIPPGRWARRSP